MTALQKLLAEIADNPLVKGSQHLSGRVGSLCGLVEALDAESGRLLRERDNALVAMNEATARANRLEREVESLRRLLASVDVPDNDPPAGDGMLELVYGK